MNSIDTYTYNRRWDQDIIQKWMRGRYGVTLKEHMVTNNSKPIGKSYFSQIYTKRESTKPLKKYNYNYRKYNNNNNVQSNTSSYNNGNKKVNLSPIAVTVDGIVTVASSVGSPSI